jgi:hypothetical protein
MKHLSRIVACLLLFFLTNVCAAKMVFYASFDKTADPEQSAGKPAPQINAEMPPRFIPGIKGQAVAVGPRNWINYDIGDNLHPEKGSIAFLGKPIGWNGDDGVLHFFIRARSASNDWIIVYTVPEKKLQFTGGNATNYSFAETPSDKWRDGQWKHICVTWLNDDAALYVDGVLAGKGKWPVVAKSFGTEFTLGGAIFGESSGEQAIDELKIFDSVLSKEEVAAEFAQYAEDVKKANSAVSTAKPKGSVALDQTNILLRASFNGKTDADFAVGSPKAELAGKVNFTAGLSGKAALIGSDASILYPIAGNLNPVAGTISFWAKPVGWSGGDGSWNYFITLNGDDDWILCQTVSNNLTFLGGNRKDYRENAAPIADWPEGVWRFVTVTWDNGKNRIYLDGKPVSELIAWPSAPTKLGDLIRIGGQLHGETKGHTAIEELEIRNVSLPDDQVQALYLSMADKVPSIRALRELVKTQQIAEPNNVATAAYDVIILPSSQSASAAVEIENAFDGKFDTRWVSASGSFPNWIELRWPQPMPLNKLVVNESPNQRTKQYRVDAYVNGKWEPVVAPKANSFKPGERIVESFPTIETAKLRYVMLSPDASGDLKTICSAITEVQACTAQPIPDLSKIARPAWKSSWIWFPNDPRTDTVRYFRTGFKIDDLTAVKRAVLQLGADDSYEAYINGQHVGSGGIPTDQYAVEKLLQRGGNVLAVKCHQYSGFAGLICELALVGADDTVRVVSDKTWKTSDVETADWNKLNCDDSAWKASEELGIPPKCADHADQTYFDESGRDHFELLGVTCTPSEPRPGDTIDVKLQLGIRKPTKYDYAFTTRIGEKKVSLFADFTVASKTFLPPTPTSQWKPGEKYTLIAKIQLPDWSPHGPTPLFLTPVGPDVQRSTNDTEDGMIGSVNIRKFATDPKPWPAETPKTEVRNEKGHPTLFVNGKILPPQILTENTYASYQAFGQQAKTGIHFWRLFCSRGRDSKARPNDKKRELEELCAVYDEYVNAVLKVDPDAHILMGMLFRVSQEWTDKYPDDATVLGDGRRVQHSFSSRRWIAEIKSDAQALVKHFMSQPYSGHIVGVQFGIGDGPETYYWGLNANAFGTPREKLLLGDYSPEHLRAFREWLRKKYAGDEKALQAAWKDDAVTFDTAKIDPALLSRQDVLMFRDPALTRMPIDYWEFHSDVMADRVIDIGSAIKEASGGKYITGCWGLYSNGINALTNSPGKLQHSAYAGLQKVLESPAIDYLATLQEYLNVRWGTPTIPDNLTESIRRHNKFALIEYDMRTFFTPILFTERTFSQQESLSVMRRDIASAAVRGDAFWWVGFPSGTKGRLSVPWFDEDSLRDTMSAGKKIYDACYAQDLTTASEVAVFMNNADVPILDVVNGHHLLASSQFNVWANELTKLGAPFDQFQLDDVSLPGMDRYKVYFFINAFNVNEKQRASIHKLLAKSGKTAVWLYASGISNGKTLSANNIEELTGFKVSFENRMALPEVEIDAGSAFTAGVEKGHKFRPKPYQQHAGPFEIGPIVEIVDSSAKTLAHYVEGGKVAAAHKKTADGNSVFIAIPYVDAAFARAICKASGVHLYSNKDVFLDATRHLMTITATAEGFRSSIELPQRGCVYDVFAGKMIAEDVKSFMADVPPLTSSLYYIGNKQEVERFAKSLNSK